MEAPYYRRDLAVVHDLGFESHAAACAPGVVALLEPVLARDGVVLELGCGSGHLTRQLLDAGHRVVATDASPAMLDLTRQRAGDAEEIRTLVLPDEPLPEVDAVVSAGHVLNYLSDDTAVVRALAAVAGAVRPGGLFALDLCDLEWGEVRQGAPPAARIEDEWAVITEFSRPAPDRFVRRITTFVRDPDGSWRRDDERHDNVLVDVAGLPSRLAGLGVDVVVRPSFGTEKLPAGMRVLVGHRRRGG